MYIYACTWIYSYMIIFKNTYIQRERERTRQRGIGREICVYLTCPYYAYIYIYIYIGTHIEIYIYEYIYIYIYIYLHIPLSLCLSLCVYIHITYMNTNIYNTCTKILPSIHVYTHRSPRRMKGNGGGGCKLEEGDELEWGPIMIRED